MKKFSLQSFVAGAASFCRLKSMQTLLLAGLFCVTGGSAFANVTVTPASGGTGICPTLATGGGASAYTTTGSITITEGATNDLSTGTNQLILTPPSGWHFNTGYFPGIGWTGGADITNITSSYSGGNLVINIVCSGTTATDQIIIGALQVQANSPASSAGYIYASTSFIAGIATGSTGTDFGDLSLASGSTPSVSISVSPSNTICAGDGVTFTPSPTNGGVGPSYTWYVNGSSVGSGGTYSTSLLSNGQVVNCVMTAGGGSCIYPLTATSNSITMTVNPVPTTVTVSSSGTYCGSTTLTASGGTGGTIYFQGTTSGGTSTATPSTSQVISSTGTYYFRAQSAGGCWGPQGSATVTINPVPNPVTVTGGTTTCGGTQTITASGGAGGTIYFQGTTSGGTSTASATSSQVISTSGTYYFRSQSAAGCWGTEGSTIVVINPLPTAFNVTGGGAYCAGGAGVAVGLSNSASGVTYQLYVGASPVGSPVSGTGAAISFGNQTVAGSYTVVATVTATGCVNNMTGSVTVSINSLPSIFSVTGTASYCAGGTGVPVGLSGSTVGVNYQLYRNGTPLGGPQSGTGGVITFGNQTLAGTYTVVATDAFTGCTSNMSGSAIVSIDPLPTAFSVSGGGSYCAGGSGIAVGLAGSQGGVNYQLYVNGLPTGAPVAGTGTAITFGLQTTAGTYTVVATNTLTTCTNTMTGSVTVSINSLPNAYIVTGGGGYCVGGTGVHVGLSTSDIGISYQLYLGGVPTGSAVPGTGGALDFGLHATTGVYTVVATNPFTTCTANMTGSVTVFTNPLPNAYTVFGGGQYCAGGSGVNVFLSGSDGGVNYQLYNGITPAGSPVAGFGFGFTFGLETAAGVYTAIAIDATTGCVQNMTGSATVIVNPLPLVFNVTGGGAYCSGGSGVHVGLSGSTPGISYELYIGGSPTGTILSGTGGVLDFGFQTTAGAYTVVATNLPTGCTSNMSGSVNVTINPLPNAYTVTTFGVSSYCAGGSGVNIFLSPSDVGVNYQLYLGGVPVGSSVAGNGGVISFGSQTIAGTYTVIGTDATTLCTNTMFGSATISIDPLPVAYAVTGGGAYCFGGAGVPVGVANSETGIQYQLFLGGVPVGGLVGGTSGSAITFGNQTSAGNYTVTGYNFGTGCTNNMSGSVNVSIDPLPTAYTVAGGGAYCAGGAGLHVTLSSSDPGISYQLMNGGPVGAPIAGTGSPIDFGAQLAAGSYTVLATNTSTGCTNTMSSSATIIVNPLPTQFTVTGGGSYCTGSPSIHVGLSNSTIGVNYQLMNGFAPVGGAVAGTGSPLDFGVQAAAGFYTVVATDAVTGCTNTMTGGVAISILPLPNQYAVLGGGQFCAGGTGVDVSLSSSDFTTNYELYINAVASGNIQPGTGGAVDFGLQTAAGNYTVVATNTVTTCVNNMTGSVNVIVNPLPTAFNVGGSGSYCAGGAGISVTLSSSNVGTDYQLYYGIVAIGAPMAGTGAMLTFPAQTNPGTYTITATITATGCTAPMTGSATITVDPLPIIYNVTGGGHYCAGGAGVNVGLSSSEVGVNYQLFNGGFPVGGPLAGTGSALSFGLQLSGGTYTIVATNATTGCSSVMFGSAVVVVDALPIVFNMNPGGAYCAGGPGIDLTLTGSEIGVSYQLWVGGFPVGSAVAGTGSPLDLGFQTMAGTYTCVATNTTTGCTSNMALSATVVVNPLPAPYNLSAGGHYCAGGPGIDITLSGSDLGIGYQLFVDGIPVGGLVSGTGSPLDFGFQTTGGTYTIIATDLTTFCTNNMSGTPVIVVDPLPVAFAMSAGGSYCAGGPGLNVTLSGSEVGVNYEIYLGGVPTGTIIPGTGSALNMTLTAGVYTIIATNATTGCMNTMLGSTVITVDPLPTAILGPTNVCVSSFITLSDATSGGLWSSSDVSIATIDPVTGLVSGLSAGTFNVTYTLTATGCFIAVTDTVNALPVVGVISGASTLCQNYTTLFTNPTPGGVWSSADMSVATVDLAGNVFGVAAGTTTISYTVTTPFGCTTTVGSTDLTVIASPVVSAITGSMTNMCAGISATLADATPGGVWSSSDASVATVSGSGVVTGMSFGSVTISYSVTNLSGCTTSATYGFSIGNAMPPLATLPTTSATVCHGAPVNLSAVTSGSGLTYQWNLGGSPVPGATDANYSTTAIGTYNVTVDNGTCHVEIGSINVVPSPVAVISYDSVAGLLYTGSFSSYQWYFDSVAIPGAVSYSTPPNYGGEYNVVVTDINGCSDTADVPYIFDGPTPPNVVKHIVRNADDIKVYPNPVSNVLYIDAPQRVFVTVLTMDGKMLLAQKEAISVNVGQLANGTYMIMIYDENNMLLKAEKFIKNGQ